MPFCLRTRFLYSRHIFSMAKPKSDKSFAATARYSRQELVLGKAAQRKIRSLAVGIVGLGGIGTVSATLCAQLGVRRLVIADMDAVDASNLGRQWLYSEKDVGKLKAEVAEKRLKEINPDCEVRHYAGLVDGKNIKEIFSSCDAILDCTDNYEARAAIDGYCRRSGKTWVYSGAAGTGAMAKLVMPDSKPFSKWANKPGDKFSCAQVGVLNTSCAVAAAMQIQLMIEWASGKKENAGIAHYYDAGTFEAGSDVESRKKMRGGKRGP